MTSFSTVIPLRQAGIEPPIFVLHGVSGTLPDMSFLLRYLAVDRCIYGINSQAFDPTTRPLTTIEQIAAYQVIQIEKVYPGGPYWLIGFSFGGMLAFEMARQLTEAGKTVAFLGMIDSVEMSYLSRNFRSLPLKTKLVKKYNQLKERAEEALIQDSVFAYARDKLKAKSLRLLYSFHGRSGKSLPREIVNAFDLNWFAAVNYKPSAYRGSINLFKAKDHIWDERLPSHLGWKDLAHGGLEETAIPGDHNSILLEPNVRDLGVKLTRSLNECANHGYILQPIDG